MSRLLPSLAAAFAVMGASACGGSDPGSGSRTFHVSAIAWSDGLTDGTYLALQVREGHPEGPLVTDAQVKVQGNKTGDFDLPWDPLDFGGFVRGSYRKVGMLWDTGWRIDVRRLDDGLEA